MISQVFRSPLSQMSTNNMGNNTSKQQPNFRRQPTLSLFIQKDGRGEPSDRRKNCGFQLHVLKAASFIGMTGLCLALLRLLSWCFDPGQDRLGPLLNDLALLFAHALLLCAIPLRTASFCVPFLLINPISLLPLLRFIAGLFAVLSEWPLLDTIVGIGPVAEQMAPEDRQLASVTLRLALLWLLAISLTVLLLCWFQWVIFRAFLCLRQLANKQAEKDVYRSAYCSEPKASGQKELF